MCARRPARKGVHVPRFSRWLSRDLAGEGADGAGNLYAYAGGNPISLTDPAGLGAGCVPDIPPSLQNLVRTIVATEVAGGGPEDPVPDFIVGVEIATAIGEGGMAAQVAVDTATAVATGVAIGTTSAAVVDTVADVAVSAAADTAAADGAGGAGGSVGVATVADGGAGTGTGAGAAEEAGSALPSTLARVIPNGIPATTLGAPGAADVFVTTPEAIEGLDAAGIAPRLTIPESPSGFPIMKFPTPAEGLASPVFRTNPGFVGGGYTAGGAPEFVIPNGPIPPGTTIKTAP